MRYRGLSMFHVFRTAMAALAMIIVASLAGCGGGSVQNADGAGSTGAPSGGASGSSIKYSPVGDATLASRARAKGILFGAATTPGALASQQFSDAFAAECGMLVTENALKWRDLSQSPNQYDFSAADSLLAFARSHGLLFRGHTLVSHDTVPSWLPLTATPVNARELMRGHISAVVARYAGKMHSWDVVNEAVEPSEKEVSGLRSSSPWYRLIGPGYIEEAFRAAAAADPGALLVYNENWLEYDTMYCDQKRAAVLGLLTRLKTSGTPVHALGIQAHLDGRLMQQSFNPAKFRNFLAQVAGLGLKIMITEMDVRDGDLPADIETRDALVARIYHDFLSAALSEPAVVAIETWGLSDRYTWNSTYYPRSDGSPVRPLPLDAAMKRKPAWSAIADVLDNTFSR